MGIYKVHIISNGEKTILKTNQTELARIKKTASGYEVSGGSKLIATKCSEQEAMEVAKTHVNQVFSKVGIIANFIND